MGMEKKLESHEKILKKCEKFTFNFFPIIFSKTIDILGNKQR